MLLLLLFIYGIVIGSFLNVVILRLPQEKTLSGRSMCPGCGHTLTWYELIPVFSFLVQRGKCRSCKKSISSRYAIIELITGLLFVVAGVIINPMHPGEYLVLIKALIVSSLLLVVFVIDLEHFLILDNVLLVGGGLLLLATLGIDIFHHNYHATLFGVLAAISGTLPFFLIWLVSQGKWMGFGDVKFMLVIGLIAGWPVVWIAIFLAFFLGAAFAIIPLAVGTKHLSSKVPFGTFLSISTLICFYYGQHIADWYLRMIGLK